MDAVTDDPIGVFHSLVGSVDAPMFVATVAAGDERSGCLVGFATQCSIEPARFLCCISDANHTARVAERAGVVVVHVVGEDQHELAELFGEETGDALDKFARWEWHPGPEGAPVLAGCPGWFAGNVLERLPLGDHTGYLLEPVDAWRAPRVTQLGLQEVKDLDPGHPA